MNHFLRILYVSIACLWAEGHLQAQNGVVKTEPTARAAGAERTVDLRARPEASDFGSEMTLSSGPEKAVPSATPMDPVRVVTLGWNQPTLEQLRRDTQSLRELPIDGSVISIRLENVHANTASITPFTETHSRQLWNRETFEPAVKLAGQLDTKAGQDCWVGIHANPGDVSFLDDEGWASIVDHWRLASRIAKQGGFRGLWFDPEAYSPPHSQFQTSTFQSLEKSIPFDFLAHSARKRGGEVMLAIQSEFAEIEIASCFWMSFLLRDRLTMGPSPLDRNGNRRVDYQWRLAGHQYGLLPAFMTGMLEVASKSVVFYDGCEDAYWFETQAAFIAHADDVRRKGRMLVEESVRAKYDSQVRVAFPVFTDLSTKNLIPHWALLPDHQDREKVFADQLQRAASVSDGMIWLYGERGTWWPKPNETAPWKGKDVYPNWTELIPNCLESIRQAKFGRRNIAVNPDDPRLGTNASQAAKAKPIDDPPRPIHAVPPASPIRDRSLAQARWAKVQPESATIAIRDTEVVFTGPIGGAAVAEIPVVAGEAFRVQGTVTQVGTGVPRLMVRFTNEEGTIIESLRELPSQRSTALFYAYPDDGDPKSPRDIELVSLPPKGAVKAKVHCLVTEMAGAVDRVSFVFQ